MFRIMGALGMFMLGFTSNVNAMDGANTACSDTVITSSRFPEQRQIDQTIANTKIIGFGSGDTQHSYDQDSVRLLIQRFYYDQYRHFQDPKSPYFLFMSRDSNVAMGVGGVVRMRGFFDWHGSIPANGFSPYLIPIPKDVTSKRRLGATPAGTALYFSIIGKNSPIGNYWGYIEANFNGYNGKGFQLKKAFVTVNDWTVGYATTTFSDPAAEPPVIDGSGPNGKLSKSSVLVRYLHEMRGGWMVGGSLEFPHSQKGVDGTMTKSTSDWIPDVMATGQYEWDGGLSHIRAAVLLRSLGYRDMLTSKNHNVIGWGAQLSSTFKVVPNLSLYGIANVGQGYSSYMVDLSVGNYDLVNDGDKPGKMYAPLSSALVLGAKYNFTDNIYSGLCLSGLRYYPKHSEQSGNEYKYGLYGALNLYWDITPRVQVGAEYLIGKRCNFDGSMGVAERVDALFQLSF